MKKLGFVSKKYESGRSGPGTISTGRGDPGGKSYGSHQLASKTGTLQAYVRVSRYRDRLKRHKAASRAFDAEWRALAQQYEAEFAADQHAFIKSRHFDPVRRHADKLGIPRTMAIDEALFSIGVQHGGAKKVVSRALISASDRESVIVSKLYDSRRRYVNGLRLSNSLKKALMNRYMREEADIQALVGLSSPRKVIEDPKVVPPAVPKKEEILPKPVEPQKAITKKAIEKAKAVPQVPKKPKSLVSRILSGIKTLYKWLRSHRQSVKKNGN